MKVAIVNNCEGRHFGCVLVMDGYRRLLHERGHVLVGTVKNGRTRGDWHDVMARSDIRKLADADLVIVNAEGSLHDDKHPNMLRLARYFPCVLMNGVFQRNTKDLEYLKDFKAITMRESLSAAEVERVADVKCAVLPDVMLMAPALVPDLVFHMPYLPRTATDSSADKESGEVTPFMHPRQFLHVIRRHRGVACGRFHAALACAVHRVPFTAYPANTWKNEGLMKDMGLSKLYFDTVEEALRHMPRDYRPGASVYVKTARKRIVEFFDGLEDL